MAYPAFPDVIDSTMVISYRSCRRKFEFEHIHHLCSPFPSVDLHFGGAFARGLEVARKQHFVNGVPAIQAQADGINAAWDFYGKFDAGRTPASLDKKAKSEWTLLQALDGYFSEWPLGSCGLTPHGGDQGIEFTFAIPIPGTSHPDRGDPIVYGGRFDLLGDWNGIPVVEDEKTTGYFEEKWAEKWSLRSQFLGYVWASRQYGFPVDQVLIRGIAIKRTENAYIQALSTFPAYMLERWYTELVRTLNQMSADYRATRDQHEASPNETAFSYNLGDSCNAYGGCPFMELCKSRIPDEWFGNYGRRDWSPLRQNPEVKEST